MIWIIIPIRPDHIVFQLQLLFAAITALSACLRNTASIRLRSGAEILDFDWTYRKLGLWHCEMDIRHVDTFWARISARLRKTAINAAGKRLYQMFSPAGAMSAAAPSGIAAVLTAGMLVLILLFVYFVR